MCFCVNFLIYSYYLIDCTSYFISGTSVKCDGFQGLESKDHEFVFLNTLYGVDIMDWHFLESH